MSFKKFPKLFFDEEGYPKYIRGYISETIAWRVDTAKKLREMIEDYKNHGEIRYSSIELMKQFLEALEK